VNGNKITKTSAMLLQTATTAQCSSQTLCHYCLLSLWQNKYDDDDDDDDVRRDKFLTSTWTCSVTDCCQTEQMAD